jgi:GNAT superfamily N-acetyltransferase
METFKTTIRRANAEDLPTIHRLAHEIWWPTYREILSADQIESMLHDFYTVEALEAQLYDSHTYALVENERGEALAFVDFRPNPSTYLKEVNQDEGNSDEGNSYEGNSYEGNSNQVGAILPKTQDKDSIIVMRIERLYVLPSAQGQGLGAKIIDYVAKAAKVTGIAVLELNVNRHNPAVNFYVNQGFQQVKTLDIPYKTYFLNDYIMQKSI